MPRAMLYDEERIECQLGHQLNNDDPHWCTSCNGPVVPLRPPQPEDFEMRDLMATEYPEDAMHEAEQFSRRYVELLFGRNDDRILENYEVGEACDSNMSAAEYPRGIDYTSN